MEVGRVRGEQPGIRAVGWCSRSTSGGSRRGSCPLPSGCRARSGGQPDPLDPLLEGAGVGHGEAVARDPVLVMQHAGHGVREGDVGAGPQVPQQVGVVVQGGRVGAGRRR